MLSQLLSAQYTPVQPVLLSSLGHSGNAVWFQPFSRGQENGASFPCFAPPIG